MTLIKEPPPVPTSAATTNAQPSSAEQENTIAASLIVDPSVTHYHQTTPAAYKLQLQPNIAHLVVSAVVIAPCLSSSSPSSPPLAKDDNDTTTPAAAAVVEPRILLLQRAPTDTYPGIWEIPGGSTDDHADPSPLAALTRELREETGLAARAARRLVHVQRLGRAGRLTILTFLMDVDEPPRQQQGGGGGGGKGKVGLQPLSSWNRLVQLDPEEHADFVWATEHEVRQDLAHGDRQLKWRPGSKDIVLKGFRMAAEATEQQGSQADGKQTK
ncbi:hypothetical protein PG993_000322 [Apiospora rasikravindrae]|uniref:Nudix hydrolase domain-containing protein n=1 Tax=Apiospora rasikravindrae TaxID=990691 RepID=A0ABR1U884_9PEZI